MSLKTRALVERMAQAFQGTYHGWEEYGVSDLDAERGILAALVEAEFVTKREAANVRRAWKHEESLLEQHRRREEAKRRAKLTPEQRKAEDEHAADTFRMMRQMQPAIIDQVFQPNTLFKKLRESGARLPEQEKE